MKVKVAGIVNESVVDGPGIRFVIFAQGCSHNCRGCHNPETHDFKSGISMDVEELVKDIIKKRNIDGVTFSGGDPFFQAKEFSHMAECLRNKGIHIAAYTGFTFEEILKDDLKRELLKNIDILMDGPFLLEKKTFRVPFRGSSNQRMIDVNRSLREGKVIEI